MTIPSRKVTLSNRVTISYVEAGDRQSNDLLVVLPGLTDSWRSYELVLPHLPPEMRTIVVSQRGHGDSDKPESGYAVSDFAGDLGALLDAFAIRKAVIAGHSSASIVARRFALDHPTRIAGLVLEGSFVKLGEGAASAGAHFASLTDPIPRDFVAGFVGSTFGRPVPREFVDAMIDESLKVPARVWRETFGSLIAYDDTRELAKLEGRTLVVWGEADTLIDREATDALTRSIPAAKLVAYAGVGHTPHWEHPERFAHDVATFVQSCR